jgi:glycosyltransferase involved in cell wall biosynthesis
MKIAEVTATFPPYKAGMGNVAYYNAWALATAGHEVTVFTPRYDRKMKYMDEYPFKVQRLTPWFQYGKAGILPQLIGKLWNFDLIHLHHPFFGGSEMVYFLDKLKDLKVMVTYHMDVVGTGILAKFFHWHTTQVLPRILDRADKIIVTSWDYARASNIKERLKLEPEKFVVIPCGVNHLLYKPRYEDKSLVAKYDLYGKRVILFVGALDKAHYFKGVNVLIQAVHQLASRDDFKVLVVGDGSLRSGYASLVDNFGLSKKIVFLGTLPDNELARYYSLADIFVLPSIDKSEAFGLVALEAMSSGVPVIASDLPGVRSVVEKRKTGLLVKPGSASNLAEMIKYLLANPRLAKTMGQAGRAKVLADYTWEKIGLDLDKLVRSLK